MIEKNLILQIDAELADYLYKASFREVSLEVSEGCISQDDALRIARKAAFKEFPDSVCAFAYGSSVRGAFKPYSDIDVVVFTKTSATWDHRCVNLDGYLIEISRYSLDTIDDLLALASASRLALCLNAVSEGEIIFDDGKWGTEIQKRMTTAFAQGPQPLMPKNAMELRGRITSGLIDLCGSPPIDEAFSIAMGMYDPLLSLAQSSDGLWLMVGKWTARNIAITRPSLMADLQEGLRRLLDGDATYWVASACQVLQPQGGPLWAGLKIAHIISVERTQIHGLATAKSVANLV